MLTGCALFAADECFAAAFSTDVAALPAVGHPISDTTTRTLPP